MLGGNLGSLLYGDVFVMDSLFYSITVDINMIGHVVSPVNGVGVSPTQDHDEVRSVGVHSQCLVDLWEIVPDHDRESATCVPRAEVSDSYLQDQKSYRFEDCDRVAHRCINWRHYELYILLYVDRFLW